MARRMRPLAAAPLEPEPPEQAATAPAAAPDPSRARTRRRESAGPWAETCRFNLSPYWQRYRNGERSALPPTMQAQLDAAYQLADERGCIDHDW